MDTVQRRTGRARDTRPYGEGGRSIGSSAGGGTCEKSPSRLLLLEGETISDHGDEFAIGGLSFDIAHRIPEVLLQHLDVAPVPGHLNGVANFRDIRPERGGRAHRFFVARMRIKEKPIYWLIHRFVLVLFIGTLV